MGTLFWLKTVHQGVAQTEYLSFQQGIEDRLLFTRENVNGTKWTSSQDQSSPFILYGPKGDRKKAPWVALTVTGPTLSRYLFLTFFAADAAERLVFEPARNAPSALNGQRTNRRISSSVQSN